DYSKLDFKKISLTVHSDSELLVKQLNGSYRIKNPILIKLNRIVMQALRDISHKFVHVLRDKNKVADKLANEGIDKKKKILRK
ncbi:reverse transcriptase-like protein, partial [bacterium]|nr:reverse transcriptase-like protein [bacterium]